MSLLLVLPPASGTLLLLVSRFALSQRVHQQADNNQNLRFYQRTGALQ
jgi:hypothetical protein